MATDRQRQISELCHAALARPASDRDAFLRDACAGDGPLQQDIASLLRFVDAGDRFLERPAIEEVAQLLRAHVESQAGRRLGTYQIAERIGVGGMGEVYRAHDTRLRRDVALKVLPREVTADPGRQARFEREARVLAALNHPNIGAVYGFEECSTDGGDTVRAIVLELIEGETLADRLRAGPLPVGEALGIATQIADALDAAHEKGIIHRDLTPSNIKIGRDGIVKVLDFGLAKMIGIEAADTPSTDHARTIDGAILGTPAYMSPEQARGQPVDRRTDIWAFGCVLFEAVAGRAAFARDTMAETLAAVLEAEPEWHLLPSPTPPHVRRVLERCLAKDVRRRIRDIADARYELDGPGSPAQPHVGTAGLPARAGWWLAASAAVIVSAGLGWYAWRDAPRHDPLAGATFTRLTDWDGAEQQAAISRDGRFVAFVSDRSGTWDAWVGQIGADSFSNLTNGRAPELRNPYRPDVGFTPDGSLVTVWVRMTDPASGAQTDGWTVPTIGGPLRPYMDRFAPNVAAVDWSPDGRRLVYQTSAPGDPMFVRDLEPRTATQILASPPGVHNHFPVWSPDGVFIYFVRGFPPDQMDIWRVRVDGGTPERLTFHDSLVVSPTFLDRRTLLYLATADDGSGPWMHALDVDLRTSERITTGVDPYTSIAASTNGQRIVAAVSRPRSQVWRATIGDHPVDQARAVRLTLPTAHGMSPRFGPDYVLYRSSTSGGDGLWKVADGQRPTELWNGRDGRVSAAPAIAPDGRQIAFPVRQGRATRLHLMNADGSGVRPLGPSLDVRGSPAWSPDGRWIAVAANREGQPALFKLPLDGGAPILLAKGFAMDPVWSPSGRFLIYSGADVGTTFELKAVGADGSPHPLPALVLSRGARRVAFLGGDDSLAILKGDMSHKELWARNLETGREWPLTALGRGFTIGEFDLSPDGHELLLDRSRDESDIVLVERPP